MIYLVRLVVFGVADKLVPSKIVGELLVTVLEITGSGNFK